MKTEKRLTMALSVLVALMMLAVPLASSSNLFVDGGQTNSNGDAPSLGAASYRVDFILNEGSEGRISLDEVKAIDLDALNKKFTSGATFYQDENGNLFAVVDESITIQQLIWALTTTPGADAKFSITKTGYILDSFVNNDTKAAFGPDKDSTHNTASAVGGDKITKNMTLTATWLLDDSKYAEIPVDVVYEGETKEYVKAFPKYETDPTKIDEKNAYIVVASGSFLNVGIDGLDTYGIVVNAKGSEDKIAEIYTFKTTYGDNKEISSEVSSIAVKVPVTSKLTMTYTFNDSKFSKIVVSSIAFKDGKDVTLYADKVRSYTYLEVYYALTGKDSTGAVLKDTNNKLTFDLPILNITDASKFITAEGYQLTGWNEGAQLLKSENNASSPLTLDAKLNGYYVIFMSKGQSEYVYVPFGELSAEKTTLDIAGVNHWVYIDYVNYNAGTFTAIKPFNFASTADVDAVEKPTSKVNSNDAKEPTAVLIACFTPSSSTSYAVFDANTYDTNGKVDVSGNFGNEYVTKLIIPGKIGNAIPLPSSNPVYSSEDSRTIFLGWNKASATKAADALDPYLSTDKYVEGLTTYNANPQPYTYTITFYDGDKVVGVFYYNDGVPTTDITNGLVAFEYDGKVYETVFDASGKLDLEEEAKRAYDSIITPDKAGYHITQWNDANKNKVIEFIWKNGVIDDTKVDIKDMKDDLNLYAQFEPEVYEIQYVNTYGSGSSTQDAKVDQAVTLYTGATFVYNGYKLVGWSDRPDGEGTKYDLGASFTLNGEQFEDLKDGILIMYAVWEKSSSGSGSGDNTDGGDNNTDTYLLAGILAVIIILIILIAFLMRRKQ